MTSRMRSRAFPPSSSILLASKDTPVDYQGSRTIEDLANFIKENGKYQIDAYSSDEIDDDVEMPDIDTTMAKQAPAATVTEGRQGKYQKRCKWTQRRLSRPLWQIPMRVVLMSMTSCEGWRLKLEKVIQLRGFQNAVWQCILGRW